MKGLWYIQQNVEALDNQYKKFLQLCITENALHKLSLTGDKECYFYFPFYEALEFENLLSQGKACLDCFSKALGSIYNENPNNIDKLLNVLKLQSKTDIIDKTLSFINEKDRLHGVIIDPGKNQKKSLRDLINHRERIDIFFSIRWDAEKGEYILSNGAILNMKHPEILRFPNYRVTDISAKVWFLLLGIIENCFEVHFSESNATLAAIGLTR